MSRDGKRKSGFKIFFDCELPIEEEIWALEEKICHEEEPIDWVHWLNKSAIKDLLHGQDAAMSLFIDDLDYVTYMDQDLNELEVLHGGTKMCSWTTPSGMSLKTFGTSTMIESSILTLFINCFMKSHWKNKSG